MNFNADAMVNERNYGIVDKDPEDVADLQLDLRARLGARERRDAGRAESRRARA